MIIEIPPGIPTEYLHGMNLMLWLIGIIILIIASGMVFIEARQVKTESSSQNWILWSYGFFAIGNALTHILFIFAFNFVQFYDPLVNLAYIAGISGFLPFVVVVEKYILPQTKHIFTIIAIIINLIVIYPLFDQSQTEFSRITQKVGSPIIFGVFACLIIYLIFKSSGSLRKKSLMIFIGVGILSIALILDSNELVITQSPPLWVTPIIYDIGALGLAISLQVQK
jgi:hypothetical protein